MAPRMLTALLALAGLILAPGFTEVSSADHKPGHGAERKNMNLVGFDNLQGRSAYQPLIVNQNGRYIAYVGHHGGQSSTPDQFPESNGTSILDVTNPANPIYLKHLGGGAGAGEAGGAQMARVCRLGGTYYLLRTQANAAHEVYNVNDPANPALVSTIKDPTTGGDLTGTHKNWWDCSTGLAYLVSGLEGWNTERMLQVYDLGNPASPQFIRNFWIPGQEPGGTPDREISLHGCISMADTSHDDGRLYCGYGTSSNGLLLILDRQLLVTGDPNDVTTPIVGRLETPAFMGAHTTFPVPDIDVAELREGDQRNPRDFVVLVNEATGSQPCRQARQMVFMVDVTDVVRPWPTSNFNVPEASGDFCQRGGRFGAHASNESFTSLFYRKIVFVSWFNAGVRAVDIRDPFNPKEVGYYVPNTTSDTFPVGPAGQQVVVIQTNNVEVDDRGFIYIVDRSGTGLHILKLTGSAAKIVGVP